MTNEELVAIENLFNQKLEPLVELSQKQSAQIDLLREQLRQQGQPIEVVTLKEAAEQLKLSVPGIKKLINQGAYKSGSEITRTNGKTGDYRVNVQAILRRQAKEQSYKRVC